MLQEIKAEVSYRGIIFISFFFFLVEGEVSFRALASPFPPPAPSFTASLS
jgi:hypothetical protein